MADTPDLAETIAEQAAEPVSSSTDGQSATGRPIADLIAADQHLAAKRVAAARRPLRGVAITQLITPGALDDNGRGNGTFSSPGGW